MLSFTDYKNRRESKFDEILMSLYIYIVRCQNDPLFPAFGDSQVESGREHSANIRLVICRVHFFMQWQFFFYILYRNQIFLKSSGMFKYMQTESHQTLPKSSLLLLLPIYCILNNFPLILCWVSFYTAHTYVWGAHKYVNRKRGKGRGFPSLSFLPHADTYSP